MSSSYDDTGTPFKTRMETTSAALTIITALNQVHAHDASSSATPKTAPVLLKNDGRDSAPAPMMQFARLMAASRGVTPEPARGFTGDTPSKLRRASSAFRDIEPGSLSPGLVPECPELSRGDAEAVSSRPFNALNGETPPGARRITIAESSTPGARDATGDEPRVSREKPFPLRGTISQKLSARGSKFGDLFGFDFETQSRCQHVRPRPRRATSPRASGSFLPLRPNLFTSGGDMADAERHVHSRGSLALGGRFAGKTVRLLRSRPVTDRGSVFVAHLAFPVSTEAEANAAVSALKRACAGDVVDHAMSAWRVPKRGTGKGSPEKKKTAVKKKTPVETSFDDDGEPRGGASIRAELNKLDAVGVACVVTRAYGGVNLGKKRFEHIRERVSKLCAAAGIEPGTLVSSDAFRNAGRANVLGTDDDRKRERLERTSRGGAGRRTNRR
jgi:hypothetical protein